MSLVLLALLLQAEPLSDEAAELVARMERVADFLKFNRPDDARRVVGDIVAAPRDNVRWGMFAGTQKRFADVGQALVEAGEKETARSFLKAVAHLCQAMDEETVPRVAAVFAGDREGAFDFVKRARPSLAAFALTPDDVRAIIEKRLDARTASEEDVAFALRWSTAAIVERALKAFPESAAVMGAVGDAALDARRPAEAAEAYARALSMRKSPERLDVRVFDRSVPLDDRPIGSPRDIRPMFVRMAVATFRARDKAAAEAMIEKHGAAADLLSRGLAYEAVGSGDKAARAYTTWLREKGPRQTWIIAYGHLTMRVMNLHARDGRYIDALATERLLMRDYGPLEGLTKTTRAEVAALTAEIAKKVDWGVDDEAARESILRKAVERLER